jgi:hypothetical protein
LREAGDASITRTGEYKFCKAGKMENDSRDFDCRKMRRDEKV